MVTWTGKFMKSDSGPVEDEPDNIMGEEINYQEGRVLSPVFY
jgi:hypothetical protein